MKEKIYFLISYFVMVMATTVKIYEFEMLYIPVGCFLFVVLVFQIFVKKDFLIVMSLIIAALSTINSENKLGIITGFFVYNVLLLLYPYEKLEKKERKWIRFKRS